MDMDEFTRRFAELEAHLTSKTEAAIAECRAAKEEAQTAIEEAQTAKVEARSAREEAQAKRAAKIALQVRACTAEGEAAALRAAASGNGDEAIDALVEEGGAGGGVSIPAKLTFPRRPIQSPTNDDVRCFLDDPFMALVHEPTTLPVDASLSAAFGALLDIAGGARGLGVERIFYPIATAHLPNFARAVGEPSGDMTAEALFSSSALATPVWSFPTGCIPELALSLPSL